MPIGGNSKTSAAAIFNSLSQSGFDALAADYSTNANTPSTLRARLDTNYAAASPEVTLTTTLVVEEDIEDFTVS